MVAPPGSEVAGLAGQMRAALIGMADESAPIWARLWSVTIPALLAVEAAGVVPEQSYEAAATAADVVSSEKKVCSTTPSASAPASSSERSPIAVNRMGTSSSKEGSCTR